MGNRPTSEPNQKIPAETTTQKKQKQYRFLSKHQRVLLVDGYVREHENTLNLSNIIPNSTNSIIFDYQLLVERWDETMSNSDAVISEDGSTFEIKNGKSGRKRGIFGSHIVNFGECFEWKLEIVEAKDRQNIIIALLPDKEEILEDDEGCYNWTKDNCFVWVPGNGNRFYGSKMDKYSEINRDTFGKKGDVLQIKFEWKHATQSKRCQDIFPVEL